MFTSSVGFISSGRGDGASKKNRRDYLWNEYKRKRNKGLGKWNARIEGNGGTKRKKYGEATVMGRREGKMVNERI